jgi:hypothetical protein
VQYLVELTRPLHEGRVMGHPRQVRAVGGGILKKLSQIRCQFVTAGQGSPRYETRLRRTVGQVDPGSEEGDESALPDGADHLPKVIGEIFEHADPHSSNGIYPFTTWGRRWPQPRRPHLSHRRRCAAEGECGPFQAGTPRLAFPNSLSCGITRV